MGSYFADIYKKAGHEVLVSDKNTRLTNKKLAALSDIVIVSVPIGATKKVIDGIADVVREDAVLIDLTSLKEFPVRAMLKSKSEVIGLHPMFSHTNPLPGQTILACPVRSKKWYPFVKNFFQDRGARVIEIDASEHDKIMAVVQALVHFADIAFAHTLKSIKIPINEYLLYATPSSELKIAFAARLLAQDPDLYANIQILNPHTKKILKQYLKSISALMEIDNKKDIKKFEKYFQSTGQYLKNYKNKAFDDTNYLIHAILERRKRAAIQNNRQKKDKNRKYDIAILGPENTYSDIAAAKLLEDGYGKASKFFTESISQVFSLVNSGKADIGLVPVENIVNGTVRETYDALFEKSVHIKNKVTIPVRHFLVALEGVQKSDIDTIISHSQAIAQCRKFLEKNYPHSKILTAQSTIAAYKNIQGQNSRHSAAIIPQETAEKFQCNILEKNICDYEHNETSFIIIKKGRGKINKEAGKIEKTTCETSIAFYFSKDNPGSLFKIFQEFAKEKINMNKIESRPSKIDPGNYVFYLNFEHKKNDPRVIQILKHIEKKVAKLKVLGSYELDTN